MEQENISLIIDFDDTLVDVNAAKVILENYEKEFYSEKSNLYKKKQIYFREYQEKSFIKVLEKNSIESLQLYSAENVKIRNGFDRLIQYTCLKNINVTILSSGLKLYIEPVIKDYMSKINLIATDILIENNIIKFSYKDAFDKDCSPKWGICKCKIVESMKKTNYLIYVGDGVTTDFSASSKCDIIYALEPLYSKCLSENIKVQKFISFDNLIKGISKLKGQ
tara:strand:+ start:164 stop:829 length:666 start_codon:yes stop_codon:yes gene_type:complete